MAENGPSEFTVTDLVAGWDDLRLLLNAECVDQVWEIVSSWPVQRLATTLVAAVTAVRPTTAAAGQPWPGKTVTADTDHRSAVIDGGQVSGHVAAAEWPR